MHTSANVANATPHTDMPDMMLIVALAYLLSSLPSIGVTGIWWSVPIGWALADFVGFVYYKKKINLYDGSQP